MAYIDFHTHLHQYADPDGCLAAMERADIMAVACSVDVPSYLATLALAERSRRIIPTFGIHPSRATEYAPRLEGLLPLLEAGSLIGEIGLDQRWWRQVPKRDQEAVFSWFLAHCAARDKYCVIHTKGAERRVLEMLDYYKVTKAVIHWYHGPNSVYRRLLDRGYYQTFGCELRYSWTVRRQLRQTPPELILAETDNPTAEKWLGGRLDGPELIGRGVLDIARTLGLRPELARLLIFGNAIRLLGGGMPALDVTKTSGA